MRNRVLAVLFAVLAIGAAALPSAAQPSTGTLVYIGGDGQIHLTDAAGSESAQVTTEGEWSYPSMADDGTIVAVQGGTTTMVRMTQAGEVLTTVEADVQSAAGIVHAEVSPDGQLIAFETFRGSTDGASSFSHEDWIIAADGSTSTPEAVIGGPAAPTWFPGTDQVVVTGVNTFRSGDVDGQGSPWFDPGGLGDQTGVAVDRGASFLALSGNFEVPNGELFPPRANLVRFWALNGPPPGAPTELECQIDQGDDRPAQDVALSPDARTLVVEDSDGLTVFPDIDLQACSSGEAFLIPGARNPSFSPTAIGGGSPTPTPGGELPAGVLRIDGGGSADPIAQAITLSEYLFEDGAATRVVLATADRFPDALAGAALAGADGPILFTSGGGDLDPRVADEIARVTGGAAPVLVLGGTAAVSETAGATARAAGGDTPCAPPLPASCRFAGSGREDTAALIADAVAAENPEVAGIAMVARGDDFADAITGGAFAAASGIPILLTPTDLAHPVTVAWLQDNGTQSLIALGGSAALSDATLEGMPVAEVTRVAGGDRTATSAAIAQELWRQNGGGAGGVAIVNVRAADGWQTALSAAVASALFDLPQLGVEPPPAGLSAPVLDYLAATPASSFVLGFGDAGLVSNEQLVQAANARS